MSSEQNRALQTAPAYFEAWTSHDFEQAMRCVVADIVCQAPAGRLPGAQAFRDCMGPFTEARRAAAERAAGPDPRSDG